MKQKIFFIGIGLIVVVIIVSVLWSQKGEEKEAQGVLSNVESEENVTKSILESVERIPVSIEDYEEKNLGKQSETRQQLANEEAEKLLDYLSISLEENETVSSIQKEGKILKRLQKGNYKIEFKENGEIDGIFNQTKMTEGEYLYQDEESVQPIIEELSELLDLSQYKLVASHGDLIGTWYLLWNGVLENGIVNPFDAVSVTLYAENGKIMSYGRNKLMPDCDITMIESKKAVELAKSSIPQIQDEKVKDVELIVAKPNFFWEGGGPYQDVDFVRLAWKISYENNADVWIDAETGECLGGENNATYGIQ